VSDDPVFSNFTGTKSKEWKAWLHLAKGIAESPASRKIRETLMLAKKKMIQNEAWIHFLKSPENRGDLGKRGRIFLGILKGRFEEIFH